MASKKKAGGAKGKKPGPKKKTAGVKKKADAGKAGKKAKGTKKSAERKLPKKPSVAGYVAGLDGWMKKLAKQIVRDMAELAPDATSAIKWSQPVWEDHGPFAYLRAFATHLNFGFWRGAELSDPDGVLTGKGAKMRHISLQGPDDYDPDQVAVLVREAIALNRSGGDPTKGPRKRG